MEPQKTTLRDSFQKILCNKSTYVPAPEELEAMTMADFLAYKTVQKVSQKPSTLDLLNIAKLSGEATDTVNLNLTGIDKALADCKQEDES